MPHMVSSIVFFYLDEKHFFAGFLSNLDEFIAKLPEEAKFTPMGELLHSYKCSNAEYEIYKVKYPGLSYQYILTL